MYLNNLSKIPLCEITFRLTLTWDVFKLKNTRDDMKDLIWLTLTWDVFKYYNLLSNIIFNLRLTLTWDVFKYWD